MADADVVQASTGSVVTPESQFTSSLGLVLRGDEVRPERSLVSVRGKDVGNDLLEQCFSNRGLTHW